MIDVESGRLLHDPSKVHGDFIQQVEWLPDGRTIVSTGADGMVSLYDVDRGLVQATLPGSGDPERAYTYLVSVRENQITTATGERGWRVYPLDSAKWLDYACLVAGRDLSRAEWSSYLPYRPYRRTCTDR